MDAKRKQMVEEISKERQRFSIRKLSIGVASVFLGTMVFWGTNSTVEAAVDNHSSAQTVEQTPSSNNSHDNQEQNTEIAQNNTKTIEQNKTESNNTTAQIPAIHDKQKITENNLDNEASTETLKLEGNDKVSPDTLNKIVAENKTEEKKATFTGYAQMVNADGSKNAAADSDNGVEVNVGDHMTIKYQLSSYGDSTIKNPNFMVLIPKGFTTDGLKDNGSAADNPYTINKLGKTTNGEEAYWVTTKTAPDGNGKEIQLKADLTATDKDLDGRKQTYNVWNQLVFADAHDLNYNLPEGYGGGNTTVTLTDGRKYILAKFTNGIQNYQAGRIVYNIIPGKNAADSSKYEVKNVSAQAVDGSTDQESGSEKLSFTIVLNKPIDDQDYIDVDMGLTEENGSIRHYDNQLSKTIAIKYKGSVVGKAYNMGDHYRLVFNDDETNRYINTADPSNPFIIELNLNWVSGKN
ncbi:hypothetical protein GCM10022297_12750 [Lactobacillus hamsteri]|uniref:YSIRK Gram-positive signal peptide domain-containing protein n=1 Tax=Lactobacillus hamsteri DSM 5661 = JCM 6256 TaxID=1423754 RepID=A0A0R1YE28_9LACO|nr:YSIRK-type signal peptide-containing protein [Lactobacillus hamsteri]KRM40605.1 hypothetical protein FC39_GL000421 [Lactobacillus hamsteri DSM 5661 = JCM 6256]